MSRSASTKPPLTKSTVSKDGGKFAFAFLDKQPGQTVHLRVNKEGYVVVNDVQLEVVIPANPDAKLLKVILCPEDEREKWAGLLYRVTSNKAIENAVQECLFTAQLVTVQFRFEDAEKAYLQAIDAESDSFEANFAYAGFSQNLNRFEQAKAPYDRCLEWARKKGKDEELAATLNNLGVLDSDQGRMKEARKEYAEALQIRRELAQKNPETYQPDVAATLGAIPPGALSVAAGPVGRTAEAGVVPVAAVYTYSRSQGLFAGASLEGTILVAQTDKDARYYGRPVTPEQILCGRVVPPPSATPLIAALRPY